MLIRRPSTLLADTRKGRRGHARSAWTDVGACKCTDGKEVAAIFKDIGMPHASKMHDAGAQYDWSPGDWSQHFEEEDTRLFPLLLRLAAILPIPTRTNISQEVQSLQAAHRQVTSSYLRRGLLPPEDWAKAHGAREDVLVRTYGDQLRKLAGIQSPNVARVGGSGTARARVGVTVDRMIVLPGSYAEISRAFDQELARAAEERAKRERETKAQYDAYADRLRSLGPYGIAAAEFFKWGYGAWISIGNFLTGKPSAEDIERWKDRAATLALKLWQEYGIVPPPFSPELNTPQGYGDLINNILLGADALPDAQKKTLKRNVELMSFYGGADDIAAAINSGARMGYIGPESNPKGAMLASMLYAMDRGVTSHAGLERARRIGFDVDTAMFPHSLPSGFYSDTPGYWARTVDAIHAEIDRNLAEMTALKDPPSRSIVGYVPAVAAVGALAILAWFIL